jgi:hypothetical protein
MIFTASWSASLDPAFIKIGISRGTPRRMAAGYRLYKTLAPGDWFNSVGPAEYIQRFNDEVLAKLDPQAVVGKLTELAGDKTPVMVCYESAMEIGAGDTYCHRHLVAKWLEQSLGIEVDEYAIGGMNRFKFFDKKGIAVPDYPAYVPAAAAPARGQMEVGL